MVPETGSITDAVADSTVLLGRSSSRGDIEENHAGNAICQWPAPSGVTEPLVIREWSAEVPVSWSSRVTGNRSNCRLAGSQASR